MPRYLKDPDARWELTADARRWLRRPSQSPAPTLVTAEWELTRTKGSGPLATIESQSIVGGRYAVVTLAGGTEGDEYDLTLHAADDGNPQRSDDFTAQVVLYQ